MKGNNFYSHSHVRHHTVYSLAGIPMAKPLQIGKNVDFEIHYAHDKQISTLKPFIEKIATLLETNMPFKESVLRVSEVYPDAASQFIIDSGSLEETFRLKDEFTFREWIPDLLRIRHGARSLALRLSDLDVDELPVVADFLQFLGSGQEAKLLQLAGEHEFLHYLLRSFRSKKLVAAGGGTARPIGLGSQPAVNRLQHASLLYRSGGTGILVDPHLHSTYDPGVSSNISRYDLQGKVDAILISHSHLDHWWLSTLMMFPKGTLIIVPKVPASTMICCDMASHLRHLGFTNVMACEWYSEGIRIGDFEIHVLPFYGEQPLLYEKTRHNFLRNWGNTYLVRCSRFTSWFLIDSGEDADGAMLEVALHVKRTFGQIDFVLSNLRRFTLYSPFYINGGSNWLTLTPAQMKEFHRMKNHCITLGPENVARICKEVGARYFLPYAHWWGEVGASANTDPDTPGQDENNLLHQLGTDLRKLNALTEPVSWNIGDAFTPGQRPFPLI